ncbi:MAG TPA: hypothetical protein PLR60_04850 [Syntrophorhabdaceae bacterium]|nr:hypothetical protein [Syntrophorhabdaceae bacterium]
MPALPKTKLTPRNIMKHIENVYTANYGDRNLSFIEQVFNDVVDLFNGKRSGYHRCDAQYHNLYHTMQTIPPFIEIIDGWNRSKSRPRISPDFFQFGTVGVLLHDTGYIKEDGDDEGTGAKYTFTHMQRSIDFASTYLKEIGTEARNIPYILNIINCTGVTLDINIRFHNNEERIVGYALGTADLLGQMSADDYIDKLPVLYKEFAESYKFVGVEKLLGKGSTLFKDADELIRSTPRFYEEIALPRFKIMGSMHQYISYHYEDKSNPYMDAIEKNIAKIKKKWKT